MIYLAINTARGMEVLLSEVADTVADRAAWSAATAVTAAKTAAPNKKFAGEEKQLVKRLLDDQYFCIAEKTLASATLLPKIDEMLDGAGIKIEDIDVFACVVGPGSFTGIRIGVATVRALGLALKKPVLPIIYFDILAYNMIPPFYAAVDAGCGLCYLQSYICQSAATNNENNDIIGKGDKTSVLAVKNTSPTVARLEDLALLSQNIVGDFEHHCITHRVEDGHFPFKNAVESVLRRGEFLVFDKLEPLYLRRSQPEREAGEL